MSKPTDSLQATVFCGIDVSAATLAVAVINPFNSVSSATGPAATRL
jgi:hypothetical protein